MKPLVIAIAIACGFILGVRVGMALARREQRKRLAKAQKKTTNS